MKNSLKRILPLAGVVSVVSMQVANGSVGGTVTSVQGQTQVLQTDFPQNTTVTIPGFNPKDCTPELKPELLGVSVKLTANLASQGSMSNPQSNTQPISKDVTVSGPFTLTLPAGSATPTITATPTINFPTLTENPGQTKPLGPMGAAATATGNGLGGNWSGTVLLPISTLITATITGSGGANFSLDLQSFGLATVDVDYRSECPIIPEPRFYGAVGALVSLGLLGYRRYQASKA